MSMTRASINEIVSAARRAAVRFPWVLVAAATTTVSGIALVAKWPSAGMWESILVGGSLGLPLLFAITVNNEWRAWRGFRAWTSLAAALVVLVAIAIAWTGWTRYAQPIRYGLFSATFHFMAAFLPYVGRNETNGFWQYNKHLFLRVLTTALYGVVIFAGLAAALGAINVLFKANLPGEVFAYLWIVVTAGFGTWFLLSGMPNALGDVDHRTDYPDGLRRFSQYVLIPLVVVYLVILTVYMGRVLVTREWPSGWIGYLVSFVTVTGILAWLLVQPLEERAEYAWVKAFSRGFYVALLPSVVMLWMALLKRTSQYGLTERRTIALAGTAWLTGIALFYIFSKSRNIRLIPMSLAATGLLLSAGPFSAAALSQRNQRQRLHNVLERNGMLRDGHWTRAAGDVVDADIIAINSGVYFLMQSAGPEAVRDAFDTVVADTLFAPTATAPMVSLEMPEVERFTKRVLDHLGIPRRFQTVDGLPQRYSAYRAQHVPVEAKGFDYVTTVANLGDRTVLVGGGWQLQRTADSTSLELVRDGYATVPISIDSLVQQAKLPAERVTPAEPKEPWVVDVSAPDGRGGTIRARLVISDLRARGDKGEITLEGVSGYVLLAVTAPARE